jgi:hypothetical protein
MNAKTEEITALYVAERERALRRLTTLLVGERVLTASLVSRVEELDQMTAVYERVLEKLLGQ